MQKLLIAAKSRYKIIYDESCYSILEYQNVGEAMSDLSISRVEQMIYVIRGEKVILDSDLAALYGDATYVVPIC